MKSRIIVFLILLLLIGRIASTEVNMAPYYYLSTGEALVVSSSETTPIYSLSTSIWGDFSALIKINERFSLVPFYELVYQGPGLSIETKEGANFQQQSQEHSVFLKGSYKFENLNLHGRLEYVLQLTRTGTNERWVDGLYNLYSWGIDLSPEFFLARTLLRPGYYFVDCTYPNYISLLGMIDKSLAIPQQNHFRHKFYLIGKSVLPGNVFLEYRPSYILKNYKSQKIIDESGVEAGPLQQDGILAFDLKISLPKLKYPPVRGLVLILDHVFTWYQSNQNSIQTTDTGAIIPNTWMQNFYDYRLYEITPQIYYTFKNNIKFNLIYDYSIKNYASRPPRDVNGGWVMGEREFDIVRTLTAGVSFPLGKFSLGLNYVYTNAVSNMRYERYYKYTYDAQTIKLDYSFEY